MKFSESEFRKVVIVVSGLLILFLVVFGGLAWWNTMRDLDDQVDVGIRNATATAICLEFNERFPGTPCPLSAATATAACLAFNERYPGTPCPPFDTPSP